MGVERYILTSRSYGVEIKCEEQSHIQLEFVAISRYCRYWLYTIVSRRVHDGESRFVRTSYAPGHYYDLPCQTLGSVGNPETF